MHSVRSELGRDQTERGDYKRADETATNLDDRSLQAADFGPHIPHFISYFTDPPVQIIEA